MSVGPVSAMVLAATPTNGDKPQALINIADTAVIDWVLARLTAANVKTVVVNAHRHAKLLDAHLKRSAAAGGPTVRLWHEKEPLETGGGVRHALPLLGAAPFFVVNGDIVWLDGPTPALNRLAAAWDDKTMDALVLLNSTVEAVGYDGPGDFVCDPDGRVSRRPENEVAPFAFAGVQIVHPRAFAGLPDGAFSINRVFDRAIEAGRLFAIVHDGAWLHVGTPARRALAEAFLGERYAETRRR